jgi:two-component system, OmpR family, phosphate regulon response regulator OmpR
MTTNGFARFLKKYLVRQGYLRHRGARRGAGAAAAGGAGLRPHRAGRDDAGRGRRQPDPLAAQQTSKPVILLTARGETADRIAGLEAGADDYLAKPFEPRELVLRINAILRRAPQPAVRPAPKR